MALALADRLLTIAVTATLTSAAWVVVGSTLVEDKQPAPDSTVQSPDPAAPLAVEDEGLLIPVAGVDASQLSDTFNDTRGGGRPHEALDIMAPAGTKVVAAAPGEIEKLFHSDAGGNTVYVRSSDRRTIYYYAHLEAYARGLKEGQAIERGETLGTVGSTGNANPEAPHLHFAIMRTSPEATWWVPATAVNPFPLLVGHD